MELRGDVYIFHFLSDESFQDFYNVFYVIVHKFYLHNTNAQRFEYQVHIFFFVYTNNDNLRKSFDSIQNLSFKRRRLVSKFRLIIFKHFT